MEIVNPWVTLLIIALIWAGGAFVLWVGACALMPGPLKTEGGEVIALLVVLWPVSWVVIVLAGIYCVGLAAGAFGARLGMWIREQAGGRHVN